MWHKQSRGPNKTGRNHPSPHFYPSKKHHFGSILPECNMILAWLNFSPFFGRGSEEALGRNYHPKAGGCGNAASFSSRAWVSAGIVFFMVWFFYISWRKCLNKGCHCVHPPLPPACDSGAKWNALNPKDTCRGMLFPPQTQSAAIRGHHPAADSTLHLKVFPPHPVFRIVL